MWKRAESGPWALVWGPLCMHLIRIKIIYVTWTLLEYFHCYADLYDIAEGTFYFILHIYLTAG